MSRVLVTPRSFTKGPLHPELERLTAAGHELVLGPPGRVPTADELSTLVEGCAGWLAGIERIDRGTLERAKDLLVIARHGVGVDSIDLDAARDLEIDVVPSSGSNAQGVAELVVLHALALRRPFPTGVPIEDDAAWNRTRGSELCGRTAGVLGYGAIGSRVARLLSAFDMDVRVYDPFATPQQGHAPTESIDDAVRDADLVTLHCPPADQPIIRAPQLALMREGATLINTARGSLVDHDAVHDALQAGQLGAYGCDAFVTEPPEVHPVWGLDNVLATPHLGGFTAESVQRSAAMAVDAILERLDAP